VSEITKVYMAVFDISGIDEEFRDKNPVPYTRTTQKAKWTEPARRYRRWADALRDCFAHQVGTHATQVVGDLGELLAKSVFTDSRTPPITLFKEEKRNILCRVETQIVWANEAHGDADNVHKGVVDALFVNDKFVNRHYVESRYASDTREPGLLVHILIMKPEGPEL
jgi:hypothetical protein